MFERGVLTASPTRSLSLQDAEKAFRFMSLARHVGKIVLTLDASGTAIRAEGRHLITGGTGDLGFALAEWLVGRGARDLILVGRLAPSGERLARIETWRASGIGVIFLEVDVGATLAFTDLVRTTLQHGAPLAGIYHLAGRIDDAPLEALDWPRIEAVLRPKIDAAATLHDVIRGSDVPIFLAFTSLAGVAGSPGQAAYAAANAALDAFAAWRAGQGLGCLAIAWGPWAEMGMAARLPEAQRKRLRAMGLGLLQPAAALAAIPDLLADGSSHFVVHAAVSDAPSVGKTMPTPPTPPEAKPNVATYLQSRIAALLDYPNGRLPGLDQPLAEFGIDSLTTLELKNSLTSDFGIDLAVEELFDAGSLAQIAQRVESLLD